LVAAVFVGTSRDPNTTVRDVLVRAGVKAGCCPGEGFDQLTSCRCFHTLCQGNVEVASATGGVVRDVADTAAFQKVSEASGIFIDDALQRFGSVQVKAESRHGAICSVNGNGRRLFR
jgi:hypothetical protein